MPFTASIISFLQLIGRIIFVYYGWVVIVAVLGYLIWQNRRRTKWVDTTETTLLLIEVAKDNEKKELSAEQMFASLHGILRPRTELRKEGSLQEHLSFEIMAKGNQIQFYVWCPRHLKDFVESQIYAQYPSVHIREGAEDYARAQEVGEDRIIYGTELELTNNEVLPIRTFTSFEVDPLAGITAVLAKLEEAGEEAWIQVLTRPVDDSWQEGGKRYIDNIKGGKSGGGAIKQLSDLPLYIIKHAPGALFSPPETKPESKSDLSAGQQAAIKAAEEKIGKLGYQVCIRIVYLGNDRTAAKARLQALVGGFKQFNTTNLNGFTTRKYYNTPDFLEDYQARLFYSKGFILNIEELASLYHLPHKSVETPNMVWTTAKTSEPPANLPTEAVADEGEEISLFGQTNYRGIRLRFGLKRADRGRHVYIVGQTGTGKSFLLELLTLSDIYHNQGFAIIDPHGDFATDMLKYIPEHRLNDVVYFNPADYDHPIAFNPMEVIDENLKNHIASELVGVLKRMFEAVSWGPRLEYILRYTILALLDTPDSTMLSITRMLVEKDFRKKIIANIQDPVVKNFWTTEFAAWNEKFASEAISPVLNKVGAFTQNPLIRNIVGQPKSAFNLREIMDEGKILIVNLSRGQVGEDNAAILGALMVTKIQLAAMSRADMAMSERRPFYLYVDEFQNFATDSFAVILSEARKYGLNLTVANQYVAQMVETVRDAVFGNVGSMVSFRVGPSDAQVLAKYFEPVFEPGDLTKLHNQHIFLSMMINGEKAPAFSATTLRMPEPEEDLSHRIISMSNERYASERQQVTQQINEWAGGAPASVQRAAAPSSAASEQTPNSFLNSLQNPEPAHRTPPQTERRNDERRRDDRGRSQDRRRDDRRGEHRSQGERRHDQRPQQRQEQPSQQPAQAQPAHQTPIEPGQEITLR